MLWNVMGPFDHKGDVSTKFPIEDNIKRSYNVNGKDYKWSDPCGRRDPPF